MRIDLLTNHFVPGDAFLAGFGGPGGTICGLVSRSGSVSSIFPGLRLGAFTGIFLFSALPILFPGLLQSRPSIGDTMTHQKT
jgi:hypothetical protein